MYFDDADAGWCFCGKGVLPIKCFKSKQDAEWFVSKWNPIIIKASKEDTIFPRQEFNSIIHKEFGFDLHDIDSEGKHFELKLKEIPQV